MVLKVYRFGFDQSEQEVIKRDIREWKRELGFRSFPKTLLVFDLLSTNDMLRFHQTGDCFVSAHRGEGWGIPQAEAAVIGNPIISTNLGGVHEWFTNDRDAMLVKWKPVKVFNMEFAPWYETNQNWAEIDQDDLRKKMRWAFTNQDKARAMGKAARDMAFEKLSYKAVGESMKKRLEQIYRTIK